MRVFPVVVGLGLGAFLALGAYARSSANDEALWRQAAGSLSSTAIRAHIEFLTDDLLEGRRAGSRGEALAARYIASQLEAAGFTVTLRPVPLRMTTVESGGLVARHDNVEVELRPGQDFILLGAPAAGVLAIADPPRENLPLETWIHLGPARGALLIEGQKAPYAPLKLALAPAASTQLPGTELELAATLARTETQATDIFARLPGHESCMLSFDAHHDGFGPGYPGAADGAAGVALLLEAARGLALAHTPPRCTIELRSFGASEWGLGPHPALPVAPLLAARAHTIRDRLGHGWDWQDLRARAQEVLLRAGLSGFFRNPDIHGYAIMPPHAARRILPGRRFPVQLHGARLRGHQAGDRL